MAALQHATAMPCNHAATLPWLPSGLLRTAVDGLCAYAPSFVRVAICVRSGPVWVFRSARFSHASMACSTGRVKFPPLASFTRSIMEGSSRSITLRFGLPLGLALPGALTTAEIDATMAYAEAEKALATRAAGISPPGAPPGAPQPCLRMWASSPPTSPVSLTAGAKPAPSAAGPPPSATTGHEPPTGSEAVKAVLRGIRRTIGSAKEGKAPAIADLIGQMVALCPDNMIGKRDRAQLCPGFAGACRRSELCALEVADLTEVPDGLRVLIRRSKGDQEGQGQEVAIPRGYKLRRVEAVQTWLAAAEISTGRGVPGGEAGRTGLRRRPWRTTARRGS
jgi:hypothetical protein